MDKTSSFRCVKYSLVVGNSVVIALGLIGFIFGLLDPPFIQVYDPYSASLFPVDYGPQLALVSCIAVVIAAAGLIGALREHFYLLLIYSLCIIGVFIFRLTWWVTSPLHQEKRFILDLTVSATLLTTLAGLFLLIFAILEALTIQNLLPFTKDKFDMLRAKLKAKRDKSKESNDTLKVKTKPKSKLQLSNNIYTTSSSIYGSGRRRSPVRMNGTHSNSSHARKYLPQIGHNSSPDSNTSHDNNNNNKNVGITSEKANARDNPVLVIESMDQHRVPKNMSSDHYFRFQSPSPSTPTSLNETFAKATNRGLPKLPTSSTTTTTTTTMDSRISSAPIPSMRGTTTRPSKQSITIPISTHQIPITTSSYNTFNYTRPTTAATTSITTFGHQPPIATTSSNTLYNYNRPKILPNPTPSSTSILSPKPISPIPILSNTPKSNTLNRDYQTQQRANFFTSPPTTYNGSNLFDYPSSSVPLSTSTTTTTPVTSNSNQRRNLFSTLTSPITSSSLTTNKYNRSSPSINQPLNDRQSPSITSPIPIRSVPQQSTTLQSLLSVSHVPSKTTTSTTTTSTISHYHRPLYTTTDSTSLSKNMSTSKPMSPRHQPPTKSYEEYVKSYRYPTDYTTIQSSSTISSPTMAREPLMNQVSDRTTQSYSSMTRSSSIGNDLESTTYMSSSTTTEHRHMTESQSVFYREIVREQ